MARTNIEWTEVVWNPIRGCSPITVGCGECYGQRMAGRFCGPGQPYEGLVRCTPTGWKWTGEVLLVPAKLDDPLHLKTPRRIFVNSMSDLFHSLVPDSFIRQVFRTMTLGARHTFQVLTKRAARMEQWFGSEEAEQAEAFAAEQGREWPLSNVWIGTSVENQDAADLRMLSLIGTPAQTRFVSCEPLIGEVNLAPYLQNDEVHQVIAGCQTGPKSRIYEMDEDWVRELRDQCKAFGVAFFYKQKLDENGVRVVAPFLDGKQWKEYPDDIPP